MNTTRRFICWLLVAALAVGGLVSVTALAGHSGATQQTDCASMEAAHASTSDETASLQSADCDGEEADCLDVRCVQSQGVLPDSSTALSAVPFAPIVAFEQTALSRPPAPAYRPPRR